MGAKSRAGSYGRLLLSVTVIANGVLVPSMMV